MRKDNARTTGKDDRSDRERAIGDLAWQVLDCLDVGIVGADARLKRIELANACARSLLGAPSGSARDFPSWLRRPANYALASGGEGQFGSAVKLVSPSGRKLFLRARQLSGAASVVVLTVAAAKPRESDVVQMLCERYQVSRREGEISARIRRGMRTKEIAEDLGLSPGTIKWYTSKIFAALSVASRSELVSLIDRLVLEENGL